MKIEALDDPAVNLPRVLDVHGTLLRLGFKLFTHRYGAFYRQFVELYRPVDPPVYQGKRKISHVELLVNYVSQDKHSNQFVSSSPSVTAHFGYPERYKKKLKLIENFVQLMTEPACTNVALYEHDDRLRKFESRISDLIKNLRMRSLDCVITVDSNEGLTTKTLPGHEALLQAVRSAFEIHREEAAEWWSDINVEPHREGVKVDAGHRYAQRLNGRLPNFDRRRDIRRSSFRPF